jgi:hypothetical protein
MPTRLDMVKALAIIRISLDLDRRSTKSNRHIFLMKGSPHFPCLMRMVQRSILLIKEPVHFCERDLSEPGVARM